MKVSQRALERLDRVARGDRSQPSAAAGFALAGLDADARVALVQRAQAALGVTVDGVVGHKTLAALWAHEPTTNLEVVRSAVLATAWRCKYRLGRGGRRWFGDGGEVEDESDCSGFAAWCLGLPRNRADDAMPGAPVWIETSALVRDATGPQCFVRAFPLEQARPGDLVVYGDTRGAGAGGSVRTRQGHVGVVVGPGLVTVDCAGGKRFHPDGTPAAVQRADRSDLWRRRGAIIARPVWWEVSCA